MGICACLHYDCYTEVCNIHVLRQSVGNRLLCINLWMSDDLARHSGSTEQAIESNCVCNACYMLCHLQNYTFNNVSMYLLLVLCMYIVCAYVHVQSIQFCVHITLHQLRTRRALLQSKDVPLRTRRELRLYKVYGDSALLALNRTSLNCSNALLALNWWYIDAYSFLVIIVTTCMYQHLITHLVKSLQNKK